LAPRHAKDPVDGRAQEIEARCGRDATAG